MWVFIACSLHHPQQFSPQILLVHNWNQDVSQLVFLLPGSDSHISLLSPQTDPASVQCSVHLDPASYLKTCPALPGHAYVSFLELLMCFFGLVWFGTIQFCGVMCSPDVKASLPNQIINLLWTTSQNFFHLKSMVLKTGHSNLNYPIYVTFYTLPSWNILKGILLHWNSHLTGC